jgi:hypothetical protein
MNYQRIYDALCKRGRERVLKEYTEKHHILPRCLGGSDSNDNLTKLTAREHYLAHYLLTKMCPRDYKLLHAFASMSRVSPNHQRTHMSRHYEKMTAARSLAMKINNPANGVAWNSGTAGQGHKSLRKTDITDWEKKAASERMKKNNPNASGDQNKKTTYVYSVDGTESFEFNSLTEAEKFISNHTGKLINHTSVWNNMKKNRSYKGYIWTYTI